MHFFKKAALAVVMPAYLLFNGIAIASEEAVSKITVSGVGSVSVAPDIAIITVSVVREKETAREALTANNAAMQKVIKEMRSTGIEDKDLQTSNFNIQPRYVYPKRNSNGEQPAPRITGYSVTNSLTIRIRDLDTTGDILDKVVTLGVNSSGGIQFTNDDTENVLMQARELAVKNAILKAQTLTSAANVGLGKIILINETSNRPRPIALQQARSLAVQEDAASVPIASGENQYRVNVTISWEIAQ